MTSNLSTWVVSPSDSIRGRWSTLFEREGWQVNGLSDLKTLLGAVSSYQIGLALIDWSCLDCAPGKLVRSVKSKALGLSLFMVSSSDLGSDKNIELLEAGIDDYLFHTMPPTLAMAKLRAHARRIAPSLFNKEASAAQIERGDVKIDLAAPGVWTCQSGKWVLCAGLTALEMKLLALLIEKSGAAIERRVILSSLWKDKSDAVRPATIDKHVEALRKKLGPTVGGRIQTVYGIGYVYRD